MTVVKEEPEEVVEETTVKPTITINNQNARGIKTTFVLTDEDVNTADFGKSTDASRLLTAFVLKMLAQVEKLGFKEDVGNLGRRQVNNIFAKIRKLDRSDFSTDEEYKTYEEYMEKLVKKAMDAPVLETMKSLKAHFSKTAPAVRVFGEKRKGSAHQLISERNTTFGELSNPVSLGQTYEGISVQGEDGELEIKGSRLMQQVDEGKSLYDSQKFNQIKPGEKSSDSRAIVYDAEKYIRTLFTTAGYDISDGLTDKDIKDADKTGDSAHLVVNTDTAEKGQIMEISSRTSRYPGAKGSALRGKRIPVGSGGTQQAKLFDGEYYLDVLLDSRALTKKGRNRIKKIRIMKDNEVLGEYESYSEKEPDPYKVKREDIIGVENLSAECKAKAREIMRDFDEKKMGEYLLAESSLMKPKKTRDKGKEQRGASKRVGDDVMNVPTQAELTMNYRDLDLGKMTLQITINTDNIEKLFEKIETKDTSDIPLFTTSIKVDKTGELELSGEGAFVSVGKTYVKSMREAVRGVKTFINGTKKFRS
jgi:hypothetical protein|tara:strand:- start:4060 stop:5658 length:1599 start_codon:yes stop_codon:yes gene_type:complete